MTDGVGQPLYDVTAELDKSQARYAVTVTRPSKTLFRLEENLLYVIRQVTDGDGTIQLTAAAKMGKEVP